MMTLLKLTIFWAIYYFLHSFFIADRVKNYILNNVPFSEKTYRLIYVIFSTVGFVGLLLYLAILKHHYFWHSSLSQFFGLMMATYALFILKESFRKYNTKAFLGLGDPELQSKKLIAEGLQKHIRHPLYAGTLLLIIGFFFFMPTRENLVILCVSVVYVFIGIALEEKKLIKHFGDKYQAYKKNTPMLIPKIKK